MAIQLAASGVARDGLRVDLEIRAHKFAADESGPLGGDDSAPSPTELLLAALASCTVMTMRLYANRKGWKTDGLRVDVHGSMDDAHSLQDASIRITFGPGLDQAQQARLTEIAGRCPVHRALTGSVPVRIGV